MKENIMEREHWRSPKGPTSVFSRTQSSTREGKYLTCRKENSKELEGTVRGTHTWPEKLDNGQTGKLYN